MGGPLFATERTAWPPLAVVVTSMWPWGWLWRIALSTRLATKGSTRGGGAGGRGGGAGGVETACFGLPLAGVEYAGDDRRKGERFALVEAALGASEGEQRLDQLFLLSSSCERAFVAGSQRIDGRAGVTECDLGERLGARGRRAPRLVCAGG